MPVRFMFLLLFLGGIPKAHGQSAMPSQQTFTIPSSVLQETRTINVWIPPDDTTAADSFFVMYMPDGGLEEDFPHVAQTISQLIAAKKMPPVILVGIENTQRRRDLTPPTSVAKDREIAPVVGGSQVFRDFISSELMPEIQKRYRTKKQCGIIGESLAGLFIMETLLVQPQLFDYYIAIDPSLWWNDRHLVRHAKENLAKLPLSEKKLWFTVSGAKGMARNTQKLAGILKKENIPFLKWRYAPEKKEAHHTIYKATKEKALIWIFQDAPANGEK